MLLRASLLAAGLLAASPVLAITATENFETLGPRDTPIFGPLVSNIGVITGLAGAPAPILFLASPGYTNFGAGNNPATSVTLVANGDEAFEGILAFGARSISMDLLLNDLGSATLQFFNGATLLAQYGFAAGAINYQPVSFTSGGPLITRFVFTSTLGGQVNTGLDNITITSGVPEPARWALLIAGFGLVGAAARRRQRGIQRTATA